MLVPWIQVQPDCLGVETPEFRYFGAGESRPTTPQRIDTRCA